MTGPQTQQQWRWAEALAVEKLWGQEASLRVAERIGVIALLGDEAGLRRLKAIAACLDQIAAADIRRGS